MSSTTRVFCVSGVSLRLSDQGTRPVMLSGLPARLPGRARSR